MEHRDNKQLLLLGVMLLLVSLGMGCGNADSSTEVAAQQGAEPRTLAASDSQSTAQVTLHITGLS